MIDWNAPNWGQTGANVHESTSGSWLESEESVR